MAHYPGNPRRRAAAGRLRPLGAAVAEHAAGRPSADVYTQAVFEIRTQAAQQGIIAKYVPESANKMLPQFIDPDGYGYSNRVTCVAIAYNTNLVPADKVPNEWVDLLDPAWANKKIGMIDARATGIGYAAAWQLANAKDLGPGYVEKLAAQNPVQFEDSGQMANALASGEYPIMILPEYRAWVLKEDGAPLAVSYPKSGVPCTVDFTNLVATAPHPNAAKLFMDYYAGAEAADSLAKNLMTYSALPSVATYPAGSGRPGLAEIKPFQYDMAAQAADHERFTKWYGQIFK